MLSQRLFMKNLVPGAMGTDVFALQRLLQAMGYGVFIPTGYYGAKTVDQVKAYQRNNGIEVTGNLGPVTRNSMNSYVTNHQSDYLYLTACKYLGVDASPADLADDEYGCADTVSSILIHAFGGAVGILYTVSTNVMYKALKASTSWEQLDRPQKGCIIISPTGYGNGGLSNGHVGIMGEGDKIMSNTSASGKFEQNYDLPSWKARYVDIGGFPIYFFKKV